MIELLIALEYDAVYDFHATSPRADPLSLCRKQENTDLEKEMSEQTYRLC